jgi:endoglucanase
MTSWTVTVTLPAGHTVTGYWNTTLTANGQTMTARATSALPPGARAERGFQASRPGGNTALPSGYACT